jgi:ribosomal protein S18 acetylase RimI-like enzyme
MKVTIREYQDMDKDKDKVIKLMEALRDYAVGLDRIKRMRRMPDYGQVTFQNMMKSIRDYQGKIFVAIDNEQIIGYVSGMVSPQSEQHLLSVIPTKVGFIKDLFVTEQFRGFKVGKMLISKMEKYFKSLNCDSLWVDVSSPNEMARRFYAEAGFMEREIGLLKRI